MSRLHRFGGLIVVALSTAGCAGDPVRSETVSEVPGSDSAPSAPSVESDSIGAPVSTTTTVETVTLGSAADLAETPAVDGQGPTRSAEVSLTTTTVGADRSSAGSLWSPSPPKDCVSTLTARQRVALLVWPALSADDWLSARSVVDEFGVGGVLLMSAGDWDAAELSDRLSELDALNEIGLLVATDEEGGTVQRLRRYGALPSQNEISATFSVDEAQTMIAEHATLIRSLGIDVVLGPVVDVLPDAAEPPLQRSRFFIGEPFDVALFARAYVRGWRSAGLLPVLKHFPGHGAASGDTHLASAVTGPLGDLESRDLVPYALLANAGAAVMVGHLTVPGLTGDEPASRSRAAIDYLRNTLGFGETLVITDALGMEAVGLPVPEAAVRAIRAGADVVLFTDTSQARAVIESIEQAVSEGLLSDETVTASARRVVAALAASGGGC